MKEDTDKTWMEVHGGFAKDLTVRDHYAGLAMQAQLSMPELCVAIGSGTTTVAALCGSCFEWADAMLEARKK
jgi:bacterioferritin-associated ferredoxin